MAETLSAILLVTTSAKESCLLFRWPPTPVSAPRLRRPRPGIKTWAPQLDNPWRASHFSDVPPDVLPELSTYTLEDDYEYQWQRSDALKDRATSFSRSSAHPTSGRNSPSSNPDNCATWPSEYDQLLGYSTEFLSTLLSPHSSMCHQKFELLVDDLAFLGHPVCAQQDGRWRFKPEKHKSNSRGRESRTEREGGASASPEVPTPEEILEPSRSSWLQTFHFVLVMDMPDPSSSASGNVAKYFDTIYQQIAFPITAVLFQEQVLSNFVETECDVLSSLRETCISKGEPLSNFMSQALENSSIAQTIKSLYEAIKSSSMAYLTIHDLPLEIQLPPYLDALLHSTEESEIDFLYHPDEDESGAWGRELSFGWRLPALAPWKSLLLLDGQDDLDPSLNLRGPHVSSEDRSVAEGLIKFLDTASVTLSLADMASLLDWDLESQVFPTVRWLVHHRRAKVVDTVHSGLKTVFTLPPKFDLPLLQLVSDFEDQFSHPSIPPLPQILSTISAAISKQSDNHFFASVVKSKELIPMYHDVITWMLKRDMLITLHLRIRVVATRELKVFVRFTREKALARRAGRRTTRAHSGLRQELEAEDRGGHLASGIAWLSLSPKSARRHSKSTPSNESGNSLRRDSIKKEIYGDEEKYMEDEEGYGSVDEDDLGWDTAEDHLWPSMINDPGTATPLQRRWLSAMSEGKETHIARRFELINQYFDGKKTDDEILYRAEITRKQLREVLHHYEEYLQTFLHPS